MIYRFRDGDAFFAGQDTIGDEIITRYILRNQRSCKKRGYITVMNSRTTPRKTVTATNVFMAFKEEDHESLHYKTKYFPTYIML